MSQSATSLYEGLFLLHQQAVASDLGAAVQQLKDILQRAQAEVIVMKKWSERKLAYEIRGQKRGLFILAYFKAPHSQIAQIDRDCNLSDVVIRNMMIRADHVGETELEVIKKDANLSLEVKLRGDSAIASSISEKTENQTATAEA